MRRARLIPLLLFLAEPAVVGAQLQYGWQVGRSYIRQPELPSQSATSAGTSVGFAGERWFVGSTALGSVASEGRETGQVIGVGSFATPSWNKWALQATGALSAFGQATLSATTSRDLAIQARTGSLTWGTSFDGAVGTTIHNATAIPNQRALADGWFLVKSEQLSASAALTRTRSVFGGSSILVDISRERANYVDLSSGWTHDGRSWSLSASAGMRGRNGTFNGSNGWQAASLTAWLGTNLGVTLDAGRSLEDLVRGVPRTNYVSAGLRMDSHPHLSVFRHRVGNNGPRIVIAAAGATRRVEILNVAAKRVELMADFTDWAPVSLERSGTTWWIDRAISAGPHRIAIRIEEGEWMVPVNLPRVEDELMGTVGLITVP